jgi:hypothetical protein
MERQRQELMHLTAVKSRQQRAMTNRLLLKVH